MSEQHNYENWSSITQKEKAKQSAKLETIDKCYHKKRYKMKERDRYVEEKGVGKVKHVRVKQPKRRTNGKVLQTEILLQLDKFLPEQFLETYRGCWEL